MPKKKSKDREVEKSDREKLLQEIISEIGGAQASQLLQIIVGKEDVNEFLIAKKLNATINEVRNILYKLSSYSLVSFTRQKDKKKGWYTYFWTLDEEKALQLLNSRLEKRVGEKERELRDRKGKTYYECKNCDREVVEEKALEQNFTCPECGEIYDVKDGDKEINRLRREVKKLKDKRKKIFNELRKIKEGEREEETGKKKKREIGVEEVKGIGKKKVKKFNKEGIKSVAGLLRLKPETVAEKTGISVEVAKKYQERAKKL